MQRRTRPHGSDEGMTIVELIIAMSIFTVVIALFMGGVAMMTRSAAQSQDVADSGDAVRTVLQRFDQTARYAESVNLPGTGPSGARYVEYRIKAVRAGERPQCVQWRYVPSTGELQNRTWDDVPGAALPAWRTLVVDVRDDTTMTPTTYPFRVQRADTTYTRQRLTVTLQVGGTAAKPAVSVANTYVGRNSSVHSVSNSDADGNGVSDTQVCVTSGGRP